MQYKHKKTNSRLKIIKKRKNYSTYLNLDKPTRMFWGREIPNTCICANENVEEIKGNNYEQGSLF